MLIASFAMGEIGLNCDYYDAQIRNPDFMNPEESHLFRAGVKATTATELRRAALIRKSI